MLVRCGGNLTGVQIDLVVDLAIVVVVDDEHQLDFLMQKRVVVGTVLLLGNRLGLRPDGLLRDMPIRSLS